MGAEAALEGEQIQIVVDGLLVLLSQLRLVWRVAALYRQRPSPREMLTLYAQVGGSVLVADSVQEIDLTPSAHWQLKVTDYFKKRANLFDSATAK